METQAKDAFGAELSEFFECLAGKGGHGNAVQKLAFASFATLALLLAIIFFSNSLKSGGFGPLLPYIVYSAVSAVLVAAAIAHRQAHRNSFTCMEGMMVGMTIGMMAGFLFGAIVGATNGMFVGSVFGMFLGMAVGAYSGKCCGIMGVMEGLMAGLMGGTMGAMLSVMMALDNLHLFMPLLVLSCALITGCLSIMIVSTAGRRESCRVMGLPKFAAMALLLAALCCATILLAPRAGSVVL